MQMLKPSEREEGGRSKGDGALLDAQKIRRTVAATLEEWRHIACRLEHELDTMFDSIDGGSMTRVKVEEGR
jgi:hypothetical protein